FGVLAALEWIHLPPATAVVGLDDVETLDSKVEPVGGGGADARARFLVGHLETAGKDSSPFERHVRDCVERRGAAAGFEVLGDKALRVLRIGRDCGGAKHQRRKTMTNGHELRPLG